MMKITLVFAVVAVALLGALTSTEAFPRSFDIPPRTTYKPRFRRQAISGSIASNPAGGSDAKLQIARGFGTPEHNVIGSAFAAGNTKTGPVTTGGSLAYNNHGHGLELTREHIPGVRDSFTQSAHANLFNNGVHNIDAKAFASQNKLANGFKFERNGGGLDWAHKNGHGASATLSNFPGIGKQFDLGAKANLWSSADRNTRLDLTGGGSKWLSGPMRGPTNFGGGLGLSHSFGK